MRSTIVSWEVTVWPPGPLPAVWGVPALAHFPWPQGYHHGNPSYSTPEEWWWLLGDNLDRLKQLFWCGGHSLHHTCYSHIGVSVIRSPLNNKNRQQIQKYDKNHRVGINLPIAFIKPMQLFNACMFLHVHNLVCLHMQLRAAERLFGLSPGSVGFSWQFYTPRRWLAACSATLRC